MSNISAAIGRGQLRVLEDRIHQKRSIFNYYDDSLRDLPGIELMPEASYGQCTRWLSVILIEPEEFGSDRETVRLSLAVENIEARPVWKPMHLQAVFDTGKLHDKKKKLPGNKKAQSCPVSNYMRHHARAVGGEVSEQLFRKGLCLPSGTLMSEQDLDRVIGVIRKVHAQGTLTLSGRKR
jgi:dTDP-4-amino-4,6-dideoxygalactose transaminase